MFVDRRLVDRVRASTATNAPREWMVELWEEVRAQVAPPLHPGDLVRGAPSGNDVVGFQEGVPWRITAIDQHDIALLRAEHPSFPNGVRYASAPVSALERAQ